MYPGQNQYVVGDVTSNAPGGGSKRKKLFLVTIVILALLIFVGGFMILRSNRQVIDEATTGKGAATVFVQMYISGELEALYKNLSERVKRTESPENWTSRIGVISGLYSSSAYVRDATKDGLANDGAPVTDKEMHIFSAEGPSGKYGIQVLVIKESGLWRLDSLSSILVYPSSGGEVNL